MKPLPWSHSSLEKFKNCPHQYAEVKVYKRVEDSKGDAAVWGDWVHTQIEEHYKNGVPWHENMFPYLPHILRALTWAGYNAAEPGDSHAELELGISTSLKPCTMLDADVWGRGIVDFIVVNGDGTVAHAIDWKTGKVKPDNRQMKLFALFIFYHFPKVVHLHTSFEWLQHGTETRAYFTPLDVVSLWDEFIPDIRQFKEAFLQDSFPTRQSGLCNGWCPVESCQHWKPKR